MNIQQNFNFFINYIKIKIFLKHTLQLSFPKLHINFLIRDWKNIQQNFNFFYNYIYKNQNTPKAHTATFFS